MANADNSFFFKIEERGRFKLLIDAQGFICGIFGSYRSAKEAMPKVKRNLLKQGLTDLASSRVEVIDTSLTTNDKNNNTS